MPSQPYSVAGRDIALDLQEKRFLVRISLILNYLHFKVLGRSPPSPLTSLSKISTTPFPRDSTHPLPQISARRVIKPAKSPVQQNHQSQQPRLPPSNDAAKHQKGDPGTPVMVIDATCPSHPIFARRPIKITDIKHTI